MRSRLSLVLMVLIALTWGNQPSFTQAVVGIPQSLSDTLAAKGSALVIVGVQSPFVPEGDLTSAADVAAQRDTMHLLVDDVMARAAASGATVGRRFEYIPFFTAVVDAASLASMSQLQGVASITEDIAEPADLLESVPLIGAPAAWAAGITGAGWSVAILDTGVDSAHPFFGGRVVAEGCYSDNGGLGPTSTSVCPGGAPSSIASGSGVNCRYPEITGCFHGTHVAGIAAGANGVGDLTGGHGVARGANIIAVQVFSRFDSATDCGAGLAPCPLSWLSDQVFGLERVLTLAGPGNVNRVAAVNMSLGGGQFFNQASCDAANLPRKAAIDNLRSIGVATVASSGNNGFATSMGAPGCISSVVSVGSTTKADAVSSFSNRASFLSLMAPGGGTPTSTEGIRSSIPGGANGLSSGTSMAAPHVAGA